VTHVSLDGMVGIAAGNGFQAPGPRDFEFPDIFNGNQVLLAKSSLLLVLGGVVVAACGSFLRSRSTSRRRPTASFETALPRTSSAAATTCASCRC